MAYADYAFYHTIYRGKPIPDCDFDSLAERASEIIDLHTLGKAKTYTADDSVKKACCAVVECLFVSDTASNIKSESIGNYSVSYADSPSNQTLITSKLNLHLAMTGLLYRGI